jgi:hypothetical protein
MPDAKTHGAHSHSINHREELLKSEKCGCFFCKKIFTPSKVKEWVDENNKGIGDTALCPFCGIDSVIGDASEYKIDAKFLAIMNRAWF